MRIRKEPALLLCAIAFGAWIWSGSEPPKLSTRIVPSRKEYESMPPSRAVLAEPAPFNTSPKRDLFLEPTESRPLPPRELPFPEVDPLPLVMPPLVPGQQALAFDQLRLLGAAATPHEFDAGKAENGSGVDDGGTGVQVDEATDGAAGPQELERRYDRITVQNQGRPFHGRILADPNYDNYDLPRLARQKRLEAPVRFEAVNTQTGKVSWTRTIEPGEIDAIELADNLENRIELRKRELRGGLAADRIEFLTFLLREAQQEAWVYDEAEAQAHAVIQAAGGDESSYRWLLRVLRARGDLVREHELYRSLPKEMAETPFRYRNEGRLWAKLTLWDDAEAAFRRAIELDHNDARSLAGFAEYLVQRGRTDEALPFVERAVRNIRRVTDEDDRFRIAAVAAATHLALGQPAAAELVLDRYAPASPEAKHEHTYLRGATAYARADCGNAEALFQKVAAESTSLEPVLGLALCQLRSGQWDAAKKNLEAVVLDAPLLRGRALAGLAVLHELTGHAQAALQLAEDATQADPEDAYALYLLGREQRRAGDLAAAEDTLRRALGLCEDFVDAYAELAATLFEQSRQHGNEGLADLSRAARYSDRLVELDAERAGHVPYVEMQAVLHYLLGDMGAARAALTAGAGRGSDFCELGLAILDYRQKRTGEARDRLQRIAHDPGPTQPTREFAKATLDLIDDHAGKEQVVDAFDDRQDLGGLWDDGPTLKPRVRKTANGGELALSGPVRGGGDAFARRTVSQAGNFLRAQVTMRILPGDRSSRAGLRLRRDPRGGSLPDLEILVGMGRSGGFQVPQLYIRTREDRDQEVLPEPLTAQIGQIDFHEPQTLAIEVTPVGDGNQLSLSVYWNDRLVKQIDDFKGIRRKMSGALHTDLLVTGAVVDVAFDDYRLVRRKEN